MTQTQACTEYDVIAATAARLMHESDVRADDLVLAAEDADSVDLDDYAAMSFALDCADMQDMADALGVTAILRNTDDSALAFRPCADALSVPSRVHCNLTNAATRVATQTGGVPMSTDTSDIGQHAPEIGQLVVPIAEDSVIPYRITPRCDPVSIRPRDLNLVYTLWTVDDDGAIRGQSCIGATHLLERFWIELNALMQDDPDTEFCEALLHESDDDIKSAAFGICACINDDDPRFERWYERTKDTPPQQALWKGVYVLTPGDIATYMPEFNRVLQDAVGAMLLKNVKDFGGYGMDMAGYSVSHEQCAVNANAVERGRFDDLTVRWNAVKDGGWTRQLMNGSRSLWRM